MSLSALVYNLIKGSRVKDFIDIKENLLNDIKFKSVADLGGGLGEFKEAVNPKFYVNVGAPYHSYLFEYDNAKKMKDLRLNVDILLDLNKIDRLPFKDKSFDLVIISQVIEHLADLWKIASEAQRITKRYILIGTPNELEWSKRILFLFGKNTRSTAHRYCFDPNVVKIEFINRYLKNCKLLKEYHIIKGCNKNFLRIFPYKIRKFFANKFPRFFSTENYFLVEKKK